MTQSLSIASDNIVSVDKLRDTTTGDYIDDATVAFTLYTSVGAPVDGAANVPMYYVAASDGKYEGTLQDTVALSDANYYLVIVAAKNTVVRTWRVPCQAKYTATD